MEKLKEKPGLVAIGAAAIATAGYLIYKSVTVADSKGADDAPNDNESQAVETEAEVLENGYFLEAELSQARQNEESIVKWMNDQVDALLSQNEDRKLNVVNRKLQKEDFHRVMMIIQCRASVLSFEKRTELEKKRIDLLKEKGIDSLDYIKQLIEDVQAIGAFQTDAIAQVTGLL